MAVMKACLWCGETMMVQPGLVERKKFCSKACMDSWWRGKRRSPETEFKRANTPQTWVPVGTEAEMKGRYVKVKIAELSYSRNWTTVLDFMFDGAGAGDCCLPGGAAWLR
jgi:hypothetical protein